MEMEAAKPTIKVAAICGSLRKNSSNRGLIRAGWAAEKICGESIKGMQIEYVDISSLPFINPDLEVHGTFPPAVEDFRKKILEADSLLFASPEYNNSVTPSLKNAIDWASRPPNIWAGKAAAIVSVASDSSGMLSQYHLRQIGVFLNIHFVNKPEFFLNRSQPPRKFDSQGNLIDPQVKDNLKGMLLALQAFTLHLRGGFSSKDGNIL
ncbi:NADPH-dependent FMN reductase-like [Dillenia turbinata]|uniref:NAD(P)H dehydrogenase (quinone) n=1 Tax=Dillenia turbinata TaxID=194707 RepID=A0AAN8VCA8_9MAGN